MRVAALYDIHGNLPALEVVLQKIRQEGVDVIVIGGDVVPGPMPRETIQCLRELPIPLRFVRGNGEREVLAARRGEETTGLSEQALEVIRWTAGQLDDEEIRWLEGWPTTCSLEVIGVGEVLFCHATPRDDNEIFTRLTKEERLFPVFAGVDAAAVVCGHTHIRFDRNVGGLRVVNAGSVGMPFGRTGADWALLGPGIQLRNTSYDLSKAANRIRNTNYPQAEFFAVHSLLNPPSEERMLELYARSEL